MKSVPHQVSRQTQRHVKPHSTLKLSLRQTHCTLPRSTCFSSNPLLFSQKRTLTSFNRPPSTNQSTTSFTHSKRFFSDDGQAPEEKEDYYELLGVGRDSSATEIKRAFYKKAKEWHPDANPSPEAKEKFSKFNEAYQVLSNQDKRALYDRFGHDGPPQTQEMSGQDLSDIFSQLFGQGFAGQGFGDMFGDMGQSQTGPQMGREMSVETTLTFMEAVQGVKKMMTVKRYDHCTTCNASGIAAGSVPTKCNFCNGTGVLRQSSGFMMMQQTCWHCQGLGESRENCSKCHGNGLVIAHAQLDVSLPPGVDDGMRVRISGQGNAGKYGGPRGHIWVHCRVLPDDRFERRGPDISVEVKIPVHIAILGGNVDFPTLTGEAELKVKPGTQPGAREILRGKGIADPQTGQVGHQYLHLNVEIPTELSEKQKQLMEEFAQECETPKSS